MPLSGTEDPSIDQEPLTILQTPQSTTFTMKAILPIANPSGNVTVTVNPRPKVSALPSSQEICSGGTITPITLTDENGISVTAFSWTRNNTEWNLSGISGSGSDQPDNRNISYYKSSST